MAFPSTQEQMFQAGYAYLRWERCPACTLDVEVWSTPGKREIVMEPMPGFESPAVKHLERCNIAQKTGAQERLPQADAPQKPSPEPQRAQGGAVAPQQIKLYGVTDKNMIACGWSDGTLEIAFRYGKYRYSNVPENIFVTLRKNPYPNAYFTKVVKAHPELYPYTKLE